MCLAGGFLLVSYLNAFAMSSYFRTFGLKRCHNAGWAQIVRSLGLITRQSWHIFNHTGKHTHSVFIYVQIHTKACKLRVTVPSPVAGSCDMPLLNDSQAETFLYTDTHTGGWRQRVSERLVPHTPQFMFCFSHYSQLSSPNTLHSVCASGEWFIGHTPEHCSGFV